jgi:hypothetical protein
MITIKRLAGVANSHNRHNPRATEGGAMEGGDAGLGIYNNSIPKEYIILPGE